MIRVQASVSKAWLHENGGFIFNKRYYMDPLYRLNQDKKCHDFLKKRFPLYPIYNMEDNLVQAEYVVPDMMLIGAIQPNMIIAAALGADFVFSPGKDSDISGYPLKDIGDIKKLPAVTEVMKLPLIRSLEKQLQESHHKYPGSAIIPPFFWDTSGRATIHGIITTSLKFLGQDIFIKMMLEPDWVKDIHHWITEVYIAVVRHFSNLGEIPVNSIHVGECSGTMLDNDLYSEFVTPFINILGREFGGVRLHSCGNADHIMPAILETDNLRIIDTGSGTSIKAIRKKMGRDFEINLFPPVEVLRGGADENIKHWLAKTLEENDGGNLKIEYHLEPDYSLPDCLYIHDELDRMDLVKKGRLY